MGALIVLALAVAAVLFAFLRLLDWPPVGPPPKPCANARLGCDEPADTPKEAPTHCWRCYPWGNE